MSNFICIDVGSSFIKAALVDVDALELRRTVRVPFPSFLGGLAPGHCEVPAAAILTAVEDLLECVDSPSEGLVLCGQMHGVVLVDEHGEAASNYISWLDQRMSPAEFDEMAARVTDGERAELGNEFRPGIAVSLLYWLNRRDALPHGRVTPVSIADYVAARLCRTRPVMEPTQAAAFGALRLSTLAWHDEVIGKLGLDAVVWPEVRPTGTVVGVWRGAPCYASVGDAQCALAGALLEAGELSFNIGTGSQVSMIAEAAQAGSTQVRPYFDGRYLRTITHMPGGRALSALLGLVAELGGISEQDAWRRIDAAVAATPVTDVRAGVAFFPGPCGDSGFIENLHEGNLTVGHVFRAAFESMAENHRACARRLDPDATARRIVFSGGVARRNATLRELTARALGRPYRLSPHVEDTLFGLMVLARAFSGRASGVGAATEAVGHTV